MTVDPPPQHDQEALYKALFEQAADGIFIANAEGRFIEVNQRGCEMLGYTRAEILNLSIHDLIPDEEPETPPLNIAALRAAKTLLKERRLRCKDGRLLPVEISARMLENGHILGIKRDISQRKETEEKLRATTQELQRVMASISDYLWSGEVDEEGNWSYNYYSPAVEKITGYPPEFFLESPQRWLSTIYPEDQPRLLEIFQRVMNSQSEREEAEYRIVRPDGTIRWVRDSAMVTRLGPRRLRIDGVVSDITERKQMQEDHQAHLWFLENLDRVNRAIQGTNDIKQMMSDVLDVILNIFACDRAWLLYPCDPEVDLWQVPMEKTKPEYPGGGSLNTKIPMDPETARVMRVVNASNSPVRFGPESEHEIQPWLQADYSVQSIIATALQPKSDKAWMFGLHQCAYPRVWTAQEERLLQEIGRRLTDSLTSLLAYRDLGESEDRLAEAERIAHVGYWDYDMAQDRITLSDETYRILGLQPQEGSIDANILRQCPHPEDRPRLEQLLIKALQGKQHYDEEYRIVRPNGDIRFVHSQAKVMRDETGLPCRLFGTTQDITERRQVEDELRASETRFRTFVDHATDAFFLHDNQANILDVNQQACESLGYTREELLGVPIYTFDTKVDQTFIKKTGEQLSDREDVAFESYHRRKDGTVFPVEVRIRAFQQDERGYGVSLVRDITERKQAEEALRASEERYRALYRENPSMFFTLDTEGTIVAVNEFGAGQLGYTIAELEGRPVLDVFYEEDKAAVSERFKVCLQDPSQVFYWQFRKVRKNGDMIWVEEYARTVNGPNGVVYVLIVCHDITARKQLESDNEQLTAQFYQAQKMESIGRLAGGIAHDFNNLLVPIMGYAELSLSRLTADSKLYNDLTQVRKAAERAADLTRQILAFSRQQMLELSLLDINDVITDFKRMLQRLIGEDIELHTFLAPGLVPIKADKSQIEQVIMNLAVNARDAMPTGGKLTIETTYAVLDEAYVKKYANELPPGPYIMLAISDTGHGIDAQTQKRIFDPFFTTKASGQGTGLGLATVFGIIKQHQGHIMVYSEPDNGTTFKIYLPKAKEIEHKTTDQKPESTLKFGTETVLVVEDEAIVRKLVCETLEAYGYNVIEARSPADAVDRASDKAPIHLLVTDVIMPELNGKDLYHQISALQPNCKVLYMSGYTNNVIVHHGILDEGINFLQKPFTVHTLAKKVRDVLKQGAGSRE
ncbi:MAG: PAS domain S-box protein [Anaerolineae bacterium]|nr:PAS domain S-box protein [Anaerolineae bacterium]